MWNWTSSNHGYVLEIVYLKKEEKNQPYFAVGKRISQRILKVWRNVSLVFKVPEIPEICRRCTRYEYSIILFRRLFFKSVLAVVTLSTHFIQKTGKRSSSKGSITGNATKLSWQSSFSQFTQSWQKWQLGIKRFNNSKKSYLQSGLNWCKRLLLV